MAIAPSPTAEDIPVIAPRRTSPEEKIPGTLVSDIKGSLFSFQKELNDYSFIKSLPVTMNPFLSFTIKSFSQDVPGFVPI
jgi:hypothetical protein